MSDRRARMASRSIASALLLAVCLGLLSAVGCVSSVRNVHQARDLLRSEPSPVVAVLPIVNYSGVNLARMSQRIPLDMQIAGFPGLVSDKVFDWLGAVRAALGIELRELGFSVVPADEVDAALNSGDGAEGSRAPNIVDQRDQVRAQCGATVVVYAAVETFDFSRIREDRAITVNLTAVAEDAATGVLHWRRVSGPIKAELPDSRAYTAFTFFDVELFTDSEPPGGFLPWLAQSVAHLLTDDFRDAQADF